MSITLMLGAMFNGKTQSLISSYKFVKEILSDVLAVKPSLDTRFSDSKIVAHDGESIPAISATLLSEVFPLIKHNGFLFVDEGQFFSDLTESSVYMADVMGVHVYISALNGTHKREPWPVISTLIPHVTKMNWFSESMCTNCKCYDACFTKKIECSSSTATDSIIDVGGSEKYTCLCRKCYNLNT
jgi:thymidine kinase